ncbi:sulfurtransferase [Endozoicomonas arenosclerae]|uniref:sulfurtransferase n=1 Tax=Endozoicomonas arenosclerae TaxID=1633495 RepID=UPI0007803186|nr:rhodanese-like domain-containing protein [Endozoicomonas arenosclerae]
MMRWTQYCLFILLLPVLSACDSFWNNRLELKSVNQPAMETLVQEQNWVLVDVRDSDWYNGWPSGNDSEGGHIPGARNFDLAWMAADPGHIQNLLTSKGILPENHIVVYGRDKQDAQVLAQWLVADQGFKEERIRVFEEGFSGWLANGGEPDKLPGYQRLVTPEWLDRQIQSTPNLTVLDVSWGKGARYVVEHIPGALHVDTGSLESEPLWNIEESARLESVLLRLGITRDTPVVVYGDDMTAAARVLFVLQYAGVKDVRLLNGGLEAWTGSGFPIERGINPASPAKRFGARIPAEPDILVDTETVERNLGSDQEYLVSIRSWKEYIGATSGYQYIETAGRIPGALWGRAGSETYRMEDYLNPDNTLREFRDLEGYWTPYGIEKQDSITFYCGTGWRASLAWFAASLMSYSRVAVYDGGWMEWSRDASRPVDAG